LQAFSRAIFRICGASRRSSASAELLYFYAIPRCAFQRTQNISCPVAAYLALYGVPYITTGGGGASSVASVRTDRSIAESIYEGHPHGRDSRAVPCGAVPRRAAAESFAVRRRICLRVCVLAVAG